MTPRELYERIGGDYEAALRTLMNDTLISHFIVRLPDDSSFHQLMDAFAASDSKRLFEASHAMKGVCANLGLTNLSDTASEIAEEFRPGSERKLSDEAVTEKIAAIREMYETAVTFIRRFALEQ